MKALIVVGHPFWQISVANKGIVEAVKKLAPEIEISILKEEYPSDVFDIGTERKMPMS
ncbi:MAG: hypothetical protein Q4C34_07925 [Bacteroidales bacterium]|nr:hypothetical protein [Bacteroidales bacterium]